MARPRSAPVAAAARRHDRGPRGAVVELASVSKSFDRTLALDDVSLSVAPGEIVVLLGLSGSGKSTLLRHLVGLERQSSGDVTVLGRPVAQLRGKELRSLRSQVGFVFQQFELVGSLTVLENVLTGALARISGPRLGLASYRRALRLTALEHLDRVGLLAQAYQRSDTLSGGQQQRVAIARALMQDPKILLADEPVASLDPESSAQVMALIRQIAGEAGLTVLCSLHQVDLALGWADRIVGLRDGRVVRDSAAADVSKADAMDIYSSIAGRTSQCDDVATAPTSVVPFPVGSTR
jgi:phosphonate transport system ATP-binding protein